MLWLIENLGFVLYMISDQHLLIAADEGIYTLNLNEIHENSMELVSLSCHSYDDDDNDDNSLIVNLKCSLFISFVFVHRFYVLTQNTT